MTVHVHAPGRVNLIGEHTDQTGGLVLPMAIDRGVTITAEPGTVVNLRSELTDSRAVLQFDPEDGTAVGTRSGWARHVAAVVDELAALGRPPVGMTGVVRSDLPAGSGLSSSAALQVALAVALAVVAEWEIDPLLLAQACQRAEFAAVGVPCGLMDQAASMMARRGHALLLDCSSLERRHVPIPDGVQVLIIDSGVTRQLEHTPYAQRLAEMERGMALIGGRRPADVTTEELDAVMTGLAGVPGRRLRHVVTENHRVRLFVAAVEIGEVDVIALGAILDASHASLRDDLEVSVPELDRLVEIARRRGALGARLTGAGFGGSVIALVPADAVEEVGAAVVAEARSALHLPVTAMSASPAAGAASRAGWI